MSLFFQLLKSGTSSKLSLSGEAVATTDSTSPYNTTVGIRFLADGTVERGEVINSSTVVWTQTDSTTDWIIPNSSASSTYDIRVTGVTGTFTTAAAADDVWIDLGSTRTWTFTSTILETTTISFTVEIRNVSGVTVASGSYSLQIINTV